MGESTNQIEREIAAERNDLGKNLSELETKAKSLTDWRSHFDKNPMTMIGVAFGGGILIASLIGGGSRHRRNSSSVAYAEADQPYTGTDHQKNQALEAWDKIKGAAIGLAVARLKDFVGEIIPGFNEQLQIMETQKGQ